MSKGQGESPPTSTIFDALQGFIVFMRDEKHAALGTLDAYQRDLLRFAGELESLGHDLVLTHVTPELVRDHMQRLIARRLSRATVRRALHAISSFFSWATRWELVPRNPVDKITIPRRERTREVRALGKRERFVLIAAADALAQSTVRQLDPQAPLLVRLMLKTGLRRSEVLALTWRDIDIERGELVVRHGKGDKSRRIPIEDTELLTRLRATRHGRKIDDRAEESPPVFINTRGKRLSNGVFYNLFHRILAKAKLRGTGITPHSLRHTFGSVLCARGVPVPYVKDLLGHEDIGSTMIYVHSTPVALRQAVRKLAE